MSDCADTTCPICYSLFDKDPALKKVPYLICPSSHVICQTCLWKWFIDDTPKMVCPLCKLPVKTYEECTRLIEKLK